MISQCNTHREKRDMNLFLTTVKEAVSFDWSALGGKALHCYHCCLWPSDCLLCWGADLYSVQIKEIQHDLDIYTVARLSTRHQFPGIASLIFKWFYGTALKWVRCIYKSYRRRFIYCCECVEWSHELRWVTKSKCSSAVSSCKVIHTLNGFKIRVFQLIK